MSQICTKQNSNSTSNKIKNFSYFFVNETPDNPNSPITLKQLLPDVRFEPKKSTLEAILAYSRKR
jgi:hypothetical protein